MSLTPRFDEALRLAHTLHRDQRRKGTTIPYVAHLLSVAALVIEHGGDEEEAIAALFHDAIEDQGGSLAREQIRSRFGERVAAIADGCTDAVGTPKPPWRGRKQAHLAKLQAASRSVLLVACADKLHNARTLVGDYRAIGEGLWDRFHGGRDGTLWYYRSAVAMFDAAENAPRRLAAELARTVAELDRLAAEGVIA
jgi:(p)ppGpp synthase/HD superfamily hydrolase